MSIHNLVVVFVLFKTFWVFCYSYICSKLIYICFHLYEPSSFRFKYVKLIEYHTGSLAECIVSEIGFVISERTCTLGLFVFTVWRCYDLETRSALLRKVDSPQRASHACGAFMYLLLAWTSGRTNIHVPDEDAVTVIWHHFDELFWICLVVGSICRYQLHQNWLSMTSKLYRNIHVHI